MWYKYYLGSKKLSFLKYIAIASVTAAALSLLIYQGAFGKSQNFQDFKEDLNIIKANEATNNPEPIFEDQFIVCNMWQVCQVIDIDDYMSRKASDKLWYNFDNNLDTFDVKDITN